MKNVHVLPTENESRIRYNSFNKVYELCEFPRYHTDIKSTHHIYITSDEEIKEGEYQLYNPLGNFDNAKVSKAERLLQNDGRRKKIILTTDVDLIKDGVQAIDDEFLEWFVKNPSCELVEIEYQTTGLKSGVWQYDYKIIIQKKEPKQKTLEEAALKHCDMLDKFPVLVNPLFSFKEGAKWQQDNSNINALNFEIDALKKQIELLKYQQEKMYSDITRVELIQHSDPHNGRAYVNYDAREVEVQLQDDGKTLKIFLK